MEEKDFSPTFLLSYFYIFTLLVKSRRSPVILRSVSDCCPTSSIELLISSTEAVVSSTPAADSCEMDAISSISYSFQSYVLRCCLSFQPFADFDFVVVQ